MQQREVVREAVRRNGTVSPAGPVKKAQTGVTDLPKPTPAGRRRASTHLKQVCFCRVAGFFGGARQLGEPSAGETQRFLTKNTPFSLACLGGTVLESPLQGFCLGTALRDDDGPSRRVEVSVHQHGGQLGQERASNTRKMDLRPSQRQASTASQISPSSA